MNELMINELIINYLRNLIQLKKIELQKLSQFLAPYRDW